MLASMPRNANHGTPINDTPNTGTPMSRRQFDQIKLLVPMENVRTVFDVGANVGQSSNIYREAFPRAKIFAFEPVPATFATLSERFAGDDMVSCFNLALGDRRRLVTIESNKNSTGNKIVESGVSQFPTIQVRTETGTAFCSEHNINRIEFLKIDAEGYDLRVCKGFERMLFQGRIDLVQVEAGLDKNNKLHVPLQAFRDYLEPLNYSILRIYDQVGVPARRCNVVFISERKVRALSANAATPADRPTRQRLGRADENDWL